MIYIQYYVKVFSHIFRFLSLIVFIANRSQFFILYDKQPHLNNLHTVFGRLLDGWEVLDKMERLVVMGPNAPKKKHEHKPIEPPVIKRVTVHSNPLADEMIVFPTPNGPPEKRL
jgi:peptidyl-prolyl cis-trans isomerase-like 3